MQSEFPFKTILSLLVILVIFILMVILPLPWNESMDDITIDLLFRIRGTRNVSDEIVLVYLGDEDYRAVGEWPITRDYFGYVIHVLSQRGARVIGFDFLFDYPAKRYPEYDRIFSDFIESSKVVCLPFAVTEFDDSGSDRLNISKRPSHLSKGQKIVLPIDRLKDHVAALGFSNLGTESVIRKVPLVISHGDSLHYSFGIQLARLFIDSSSRFEIDPNALYITCPSNPKIRIPLDSQGRMRLNHFGGLENISSIGFLDLLKIFESTPDSLDFSEKLVIVAATTSSLPVIKATPLSEILPASLLHVSVAENIIFHNFLRELPRWIEILFIIMMMVSACRIWRLRQKKWVVIGFMGILFFCFLVTIVLFTTLHLVLPVVYPFITFLITGGVLGFITQQNRRVYNLSENQFFLEQMTNRQRQLEEAESKLRELEDQLKDEVREKKVLSEKSQALAEEKQAAVMALEKQIRDMEAYSIPSDRLRKSQYREIIHASNSKMVGILDMIEKIGFDDISVLIQGETGTGKELIARAIHKTGKRKKAPFVAINGGALPETLLESELFGHEKGSFTGAQSRRRGRFELADGGTLFLDEITETSPSFQAKLLRVLQEGTFERLGSERSIRTDIRLIAATNKDLKSEVNGGHFREDLYYRLQGFTLELPPLRERRDDIPLLVRHFLEKHGYHKIASVSDRVHQLILTYRWPGNVRELENVLRRAAILAQSDGRDMIQAGDLPQEIHECESPALEKIAYQPLEDQILTMLRAFKFSRSSISQTARALGNRDRGTITEYFRGICFELLVKNDFDVDRTARDIAGTDDDHVVESVKSKIKGYLDNIETPLDLDTQYSNMLPSCYRGLPQKYHPFLGRVIEYLSEIR